MPCCCCIFFSAPLRLCLLMYGYLRSSQLRLISPAVVPRRTVCLRVSFAPVVLCFDISLFSFCSQWRFHCRRVDKKQTTRFALRPKKLRLGSMQKSKPIEKQFVMNNLYFIVNVDADMLYFHFLCVCVCACVWSAIHLISIRGAPASLAFRPYA